MNTQFLHQLIGFDKKKYSFTKEVWNATLRALGIPSNEYKMLSKNPKAKLPKHLVSKMKPLYDYDAIFLPFGNGAHWFLIVIHPGTQSVHALDSLPNLSNSRKVLQASLAWFVDFNNLFQGYEFDADKWVLVKEKDLEWILVLVK